MSAQKLNITIGVVLCLLGSFMASIALTLTPMTDTVISGTVSAVNKGAPLEMFQYYINGLLAGGYISIIPVWIIHLLGFISIVLIYTGAHGIINRKKARPYSYLFKLGYWKEFQSNIEYKAPVKVKKKRG